ncbi:MAG: alpha-1,2-fucosyltransferase [Muribaculaceae bacterium]
MKKVFLSGGLGNQMFQYAFYKELLNKYCDVKCDWGLLKNRNVHNGYELSRIFGVTDVECKSSSCFMARVLYYLRVYRQNLCLNLLRRILGCDVVFDEKDLTNSYRNLYILGYWQSEKYIPNNFRFRFKDTLLSDKTKKLCAIIESANSVSIHVRRGDYITKGNIGIYGNICTIEYYKNAINRICEIVDAPKFFVFSNDITWVKDNLPLGDAVFVSHNSGMDSWQDMYLMSKCKHNIIANSTFSWWGAWLNENEDKKVICPPKFANSDINKEIFPTSWIKVESI